MESRSLGTSGLRGGCVIPSEPTLTQRLRELQDVGIVEVEREPGRRGVRYRLTAAGADLEPALDALSWWGMRHAWRPPRTAEPLHVEHLLHAVIQVINRRNDDAKRASWHLRLGDKGDYFVNSDGLRWSLTTQPTVAEPDVIITATPEAFIRFVSDPSSARAEELDINIEGDGNEVTRLARLLRTFAEEMTNRDGGTAPA